MDLAKQWLPLLAAQLYLICLVYLSVSRMRYGASFRYLATFLGSVVCFLLLYLVDQFANEGSSLPFVNWRLRLLLSIGFPSLTLACFTLCEVPVGRNMKWSLYGVSAFIAFIHGWILDLAWKDFFHGEPGQFFGVSTADFDGFLVTQYLASLTTLGVVILPCVWLLREWKHQPVKNRALIVSSLLFAVLFLVGIVFRAWWIYYLGSILSALIFLSALYLDLHFLNQSSAYIKDSLRQHVTSGSKFAPDKLTKLIESLEASSGGNLEVYKLRVSEVLSMMTDEAIESGGDTEALLRRNRESIEAVQEEQDIKTLSKTTASEAETLSKLIVNLPDQRRAETITKVKAHILEHLEDPLQINEIAEVFCISRSYLTNGFKEVEGETLNQFITRTRIEKSKDLLRSYNVTETAFKVGFQNSNYFSTVFKKVVGVSPKKFQESLKSDNAL